MSNDAEKRAMFQRERQWFEANYGNGEVDFDETGRMLLPKSVDEDEFVNKFGYNLGFDF